jgi:hypothetical protein
MMIRNCEAVIYVLVEAKHLETLLFVFVAYKFYDHFCRKKLRLKKNNILDVEVVAVISRCLSAT